MDNINGQFKEILVVISLKNVFLFMYLFISIQLKSMKFSFVLKRFDFHCYGQLKYFSENLLLYFTEENTGLKLHDD